MSTFNKELTSWFFSKPELSRTLLINLHKCSLSFNQMKKTVHSAVDEKHGGRVLPIADMHLFRKF
jgi:hypothetical protein